MEVYTEKMKLWEEYFSSSIEHKMKVYAEKMKLWEESIYSSLDKVVEAKKKTETFVESHLQDQTRFNECFFETIDHFKLQSENKTEMYDTKMNTLLDSFSSTIQELSEAERKIENTMQASLHQEQNRFDASFDKLVELSNRFNTSLQEIALKEQKDKQIRPAFFSTLSKTFVLSNSNKVLIFEGVKVNRGGGYDPLSGIFTAKRDGLYHFSCVIYGESGKGVGYQLNKNDLLYVRGYSNNGEYGASSISVLVELKKGDRVYIKHRHSGQTEAVIGNDHSSFGGYFLQD
ncbi:heavy metal-binding protein HIP-like [Mytilus trossulus]|uniref:heavy metal-binding protein HIP-like n=1 Tax=Mytilus trossulus TaxID=6551 RepID=UPI003007D8E7